MPKRIAYYASENIKTEKKKNGKGHKMDPDGSFELSDQGKMPFGLFLVFRENFFGVDKISI